MLQFSTLNLYPRLSEIVIWAVFFMSRSELASLNLFVEVLILGVHYLENDCKNGPLIRKIA